MRSYRIKYRQRYDAIDMRDRIVVIQAFCLSDAMYVFRQDYGNADWFSVEEL